MKINSILNLFSPKDTIFFPLLRNAADCLVKSSNYLLELYQDPLNIPKREELSKLIKNEELEGDRITARIMKELNNNFITPFDREDINMLIDQMDDVNDEIYRSAHKVVLYSPKRLPECAVKMAELIAQGSHEIQSAVKELDTIKKTDGGFKQYYRTIKHIEEEGDVLFESGIMNLFKDEADATELLKSKELIQCLEKTINRINSTGKVLKTIYIKYA